MTRTTKARAIRPRALLIDDPPRPRLVFRIAHRLYQVKLSAGKLHTDPNREVAGYWSWYESAIWLSGELPTEQRLSVLMHELRHAWLDAFGSPRDDESDCNSASSFAIDMFRQLQGQGGELALREMTPEHPPTDSLE